MNIPGFTAESSVNDSKGFYNSFAIRDLVSDNEGIIIPAWRVACGSRALTDFCFFAGFPYFIPCWGNSGCIFAVVVSHFPFCVSCAITG